VQASLSVQAGETLALVGPSGCGKSTSLRVLAGLARPDSGTVTLDGRPLVDTARGIALPPEERNLGYVVQSYALFPHLTVADNVAYGLSGHDRGERETRVREALDVVSIGHLAARKPRMLSGGEQQRVALARALVRRPGVLLLDEPLSALDVSTRGRVRIELGELLGALSIPTIVVTHDLEDARMLGRRIAVMMSGRIVQVGTPEEVARTPNNGFVAAFTDTNLLAARDGRWLAFDPWKVSLGPRPTGGEHEWRGEVRDVSAAGSLARVRLETDAGEPLVAHLPEETVAPARGEAMYATVAGADVRPVEPADHAEHDDASREDDPPPGARRGPGVRASLVALLALVLAFAGAAAYARSLSGGGDEGAMTVHIAANMTDAYDALIEAFEQERPGARIRPTYAGTQILLTQLQQGAQSGLFLAADLRLIREAKAEGLIDSFVPVSRTQPVIVVPKANPAGVEGLKDLGTKDVKLVIGVEEVPVGQYARQVFANAGRAYGRSFPQEVMRRVVSTETNTKEVAQKVASGDADAAVVYVTDVNESLARKVRAIEIPEDFNVVATNYAGVVKDAEDPQLARELLDFTRSPAGQRVIERFDYLPLESD